ncbi:MAG: hypothetical protein ACKO8W_07680 [Dolichospermum sp.]
MRYILSPLLACGEGVGGGVTLYLITSVSAVYHGNNIMALVRSPTSSRSWGYPML